MQPTDDTLAIRAILASAEQHRHIRRVTKTGMVVGLATAISVAGAFLTVMLTGYKRQQEPDTRLESERPALTGINRLKTEIEQLSP